MDHPKIQGGSKAIGMAWAEQAGLMTPRTCLEADIEAHAWIQELPQLILRPSVRVPWPDAWRHSGRFNSTFSSPTTLTADLLSLQIQIDRERNEGDDVIILIQEYIPAQLGGAALVSAGQILVEWTRGNNHALLAGSETGSRLVLHRGCGIIECPSADFVRTSENWEAMRAVLKRFDGINIPECMSIEWVVGVDNNFYCVQADPSADIAA